jgi:hypothetical protein
MELSRRRTAQGGEKAAHQYRGVKQSIARSHVVIDGEELLVASAFQNRVNGIPTAIERCKASRVGKELGGTKMAPFLEPKWTEEGPGPFSVSGIGYSKAAGAIQALATDPVDLDRVFVATVGGGVWRSTDAVSARDPTWVPLTDFMPSLSMSAIAFSPLDQNRNTLYAG